MHVLSGVSSLAHPVRSARDKVLSIEGLATVAERARREGRSVVLCHGVFDLLHLGHVRHLEAARREGSLLIVTLTADRFVNKGPGRPVFSQQLRAEMVASLEYVDWAGINEEPSAENLLRAIQPDVYVKGSDYIAAADDVTGKITAEREAVESYGGRIVFTTEETYSSSTLINKYLNIYDPSLQSYLEQMRTLGALDRLVEAIERLRTLRILFVGDAIVDEYSYVQPMGKSPKENMIATLFQEQERFAGGVFAAANHAAGLCARVDVLTGLGEADGHEDLIRGQLKPNVNLDVVWRERAPTTRKTRFIDGYSMRKLFEVYAMDDTPLPAGPAAAFLALLEERVPDYDVVVVTDFGHGLLGPAAIDLLQRKARFLAVNAQTNSANQGFNLITKYRHCDFACIDSNEARLAARDKFSDMADLIGLELASAMDCRRMIVTQGKLGCVAFDRTQGLWRVPALTSTIVDTVGAGDAFFSVTAPAVAQGLPMDLAGFLGNAAGALKVGIVGHRSAVEKAALVKFITALLK